MKYEFLSKIESPKDLQSLSFEQLDKLSEEIRDCILNTVSKNGGHLSSNLGVVELTVALHRVFKTPEDTIIFDVGHQSYTHKLLTGRYADFSTLRTENGISGFLRPGESSYDAVISGHSSTSVSSAFGIHKGNLLKGSLAKTVAVIGDGALSGGMVYEALNNVGRDKSNLIVILNDNTMSISKNVGALARHLNLIRQKPGYFKTKRIFKSIISAIPFVGRNLKNRLSRSKNMLKNAIYNSNIFDGFGLNYMGPVDGHNIEKLESMLKIAKESPRPVLLHVITTKGKGYPYAQEKPDAFHGVSAFDLKSGSISGSENFSSAFGKKLTTMAEKDDSICAITAAMPAGTGLNYFATKHRNRFFDVGIAEEHAVTFAAGLAKAGLKPFFAVYSSFLQRAYDQLVHDVAIAELPVTLCVDRAGIVGEDGETHQGLLDPAFLSSVPGTTVYSPSNYAELSFVLEKAAHRTKGLWAIRYPRGSEPENLKEYKPSETDFVHTQGKDILLITYGVTFSEAVKAKEKMPNIGLLKLNRINPLPSEAIDIAKQYKNVLFFEEASKTGGIAQQFASKLCEIGFKGVYKNFSVDGFVPQGTVKAMRHKYLLDCDGMIGEIEKCQKNCD